MPKYYSFHIPVMFDEALDALDIQPGGRYIDATTGGGGHSKGILERSKPNGQVLGIDADPEALDIAKKLLSDSTGRYHSVQGNFASMTYLSEKCGFRPVEGILMDLGMSSLQLESGNRGFSFRRDEPLDMRYDPQIGKTAGSIINKASLGELTSIIKNFGEEPRATKIANIIVRSRPIKSSSQLAEIIKRSSGYKHSKLHPATRVFQALRIAVNDELVNLRKGLEAAASTLVEGGRLVVIAYHSLEDRIVKEFFKQPTYNGLSPISKKVIKPSREEVLSNRRSRSARLRCAEYSALTKQRSEFGFAALET